MLNLKSSLVISTYNFPKALNLVLKSLTKQSVMPYEVLIADDGSKNETKQVIDFYKKKISLPIKHIWHKDVGFTKSTILNKAIARAKGDYIIQIDGDCILHMNFVSDHLKMLEKDQYLFGSRVNIQKEYLGELYSSEKVNYSLFSKGIKKRTRAIYAPFFGKLYKSSNSFSNKFRGCNTSFFKSDFIAVNGYNEEFKGWGREDSELALRFHNYGLNARRLRYQAIVYHIYHPEKPKDQLELNNDIQNLTIKNKLTWCENGIDKYL